MLCKLGFLIKMKFLLKTWYTVQSQAKIIAFAILFRKIHWYLKIILNIELSPLQINKRLLNLSCTPVCALNLANLIEPFIVRFRPSPVQECAVRSTTLGLAYFLSTRHVPGRRPGAAAVTTVCVRAHATRFGSTHCSTISQCLAHCNSKGTLTWLAY